MTNCIIKNKENVDLESYIEEKGSRMDLRDTDTSIAYQNKDIVSKLFGQQMKGKSLSLFGLISDLRTI